MVFQEAFPIIFHMTSNDEMKAGCEFLFSLYKSLLKGRKREERDVISNKKFPRREMKCVSADACVHMSFRLLHNQEDNDFLSG